jgi:hypothetical protein
VSRIEEEGGTALFIPTDVTNDDSVEALVQEILRFFGRLDIMVNRRAEREGMRKTFSGIRMGGHRYPGQSRKKRCGDGEDCGNLHPWAVSRGDEKGKTGIRYPKTGDESVAEKDTRMDEKGGD